MYIYTHNIICNIRGINILYPWIKDSIHPHPRFTEVGVFFASFGNSRILVNQERMMCW